MNIFELGFTPPQETLIAAGTDSYVFLTDKAVIKSYKHISPEQLLKYKKLTDEARDIFQPDPYIDDFYMDGERWSINVAIVPIIDVDLSTDNPVAVSEYIPGPQFQITHPDLAMPDVNCLPDPIERQSLSRLIELMYSTSEGERNQILDPPVITTRIAEKISKKTHVNNLSHIEGKNIKMRAQPEVGILHLLVTDIGDSIATLEFPEGY